MHFDTMIDRRGTYCTQWDFVKDRFGEADLLPFTISDTDFAVPDEVLDALKSRLEHPVFGYTRWNHSTLKKAISNWYHTRFDTVINEEWIMYSPTVIYAISAVIQMVTKENEGIIVQLPAYDAFFKVIENNNRKLAGNELLYENGKYMIDFEDLERKMSKKENRLLLLCSPHNPTGRVWKKWELEKIIELCRKYDVFLLSDEIHMDILRNGQKHLPITGFSYEKTAIVTSGSKTFNFPGLIFAYVLLPDEQLREDFQLKLKNADGLSSTSTLGMLATMTAYDKCGYWVDELNQYLESNQHFVIEFLHENLPEVKAIDIEATYLMWLDISEVKNQDKLREKLITAGKVAIMDGSIYGGNGSDFLRLNIGCSREKLEAGLEGLLTAFEAMDTEKANINIS